MKLKFNSFACILALVIACTGCSSDKEKPTEGVKVWVTTGDQKKLLEPGFATDGEPSSSLLIEVNSQKQFQEIEGFGAAMTGSSAYVIQGYLSAENRTSLLKDLFDPQVGIGLSYIRATIGASDFSLLPYSYDDTTAGQSDLGLSRFSIDREKDALIPVLKEVFAIQPGMKLIGSPWSPPAWMKDSGKMEGGSLNTVAYSAFADYFVKYIRAFEAEGIKIEAVTIQNEPQNEANYPTMLMTAPQQNDFIKNHLGPRFQQESISTKIVLFDHNWDAPEYPIEILNDPVTRQFVAGSAFHCYKGDVSAMSKVHDAHPDKALYFTECSGGEWAPDFASNLRWYTDTLLIGTMNNWSQSVLVWNIALDENHGPTTNKPNSGCQGNCGCMNCRGVVTVNSKTGSVTRNVEYYAFGHFAKFVRPQAHRIYSSQFRDQGIDNIAFKNSDGTNVMVVLNKSSAMKSLMITADSVKSFGYTLEPGSVATFVW